MLEIIGVVVTTSVVLGFLPMVLLYILRRLDAERKRLDELEARVERLESRTAS